MSYLVLNAGGLVLPLEVADATGGYPGIPAVPAVLLAEHTMYSGQTFDYAGDGGVQTYRESADGPYTHYIYPQHPNATNTANPYGTEDRPRLTFPGFPAGGGCIAEFHGTFTNQVVYVSYSGTAEKPNFIRGTAASPCNLVWDSTGAPIYCAALSYCIFEHFNIDLNESECSAVSFYPHPNSYIAFRNLDISNFKENAGASRSLINIHQNDHVGTLSYMLVKNCTIHDNNELKTGVKVDCTGVFCGCNASHIWIIDNECYAHGGDFVQIDRPNPQVTDECPNHIYIAGNTVHDMYENFVDIKTGQDVIISSNTMYDFGSYSPSFGDTKLDSSPLRFGVAYMKPEFVRERIWVLFNHAYRCQSGNGTGVFGTWNNPGPGALQDDAVADETYFIGNLIHDCKSQSGTNSIAFLSGSQKRVYWYNNTVCGVDTGMVITESPTWEELLDDKTCVNNIFADITSTVGTPLWLWLNGTDAQLASWRRERITGF